MNSEIIVALIGAAVTVANVVYANISARRKKCSERTEHLENGVQCLLRAEIIRSHEKYIDKGFCPIYAKEALTKEYKAYHNLGGNDVATELYEQCIALPNERSNSI